MPDLKPLIGYIVDQINDREGVVGKTALVKLVYLVDVEHYRRYGRTVSGLSWRFYHYGPYAAELEQVIRENRFVNEYGNRERPGYRYFGKGDWQDIHRVFNAHFGSSVKHVADWVIEQWGIESLEIILDYVYFETEPMQDAQRGENLDFTKIKKEEQVTARKAASHALPEATSNDFRNRLKQRREQTTRRLRQATEPVYDQVYADASKLMAEDEGRFAKVRPNTKVSGPNREQRA